MFHAIHSDPALLYPFREFLVRVLLTIRLADGSTPILGAGIVNGMSPKRHPNEATKLTL